MADKTPQDPPISIPSSAAPPKDPDTCPNLKKRKNSTITLENFDLITPPPANSFTFDTVFVATPENTPKFGSFNLASEIDCVGILETGIDSAADFLVESETTTTAAIKADCGTGGVAKKRKKEVDKSEERRKEVVLDSVDLGIESSVVE